MTNWIIVCAAAALTVLFAGDVYLWLLSGHLRGGRALAGFIVKATLPAVRYAIGLGLMGLAYRLYERRKYRMLALIADSPDCPRCGGLMRQRNSRSGAGYWGCPACRYRMGY